MSGVQGCRKCQGVLGAGRNCRYSGARRSIGVIRVYWGLLRVGVLGPLRDIRGCRGARGVLGWQVDWEPNHIGPKSRVPALPLVPLGE